MFSIVCLTICLSTWGGVSHVTITDKCIGPHYTGTPPIWDLTVQESPPPALAVHRHVQTCSTWTSLYKDNLPQCWHLMNTYGGQAGGTHPSGMFFFSYEILILLTKTLKKPQPIPRKKKRYTTWIRLIIALI